MIWGGGEEEGDEEGDDEGKGARRRGEGEVAATTRRWRIEVARPTGHPEIAACPLDCSAYP